MGLADTIKRCLLFCPCHFERRKHMNKEEMKQLILEAVSVRLGNGCNGVLQEVLKTNLKRDGLTIFQTGNNIAPTIYLDPFYEDLEKGVPIDDVADRILNIYLGVRDCPWQFDTRSILDFSCIKDRLYVELINRHSNTELLKDVPHKQFLDDFAIVMRCLIKAADDGNSSFLVHNSHLDMWNVDQKPLLSFAIQNTRKLFGVELRDMEDVLKELIPCMETGCSRVPMWVLSNRHHLAGASAVLFHDVLEDFSQKYGSFYVIFSSVHEALLIPVSSDMCMDELTKMNREINKTDVSDEEVLGTKAYLYTKENGFVI